MLLSVDVFADVVLLFLEASGLSWRKTVSAFAESSFPQCERRLSGLKSGAFSFCELTVILTVIQSGLLAILPIVDSLSVILSFRWNQ